MGNFYSDTDSKLEYREELENELFETICMIDAQVMLDFLGIKDDLAKMIEEDEDELDDHHCTVSDRLTEAPDEDFRRLWKIYLPHKSIPESQEGYRKEEEDPSFCYRKRL